MRVQRVVGASGVPRRRVRAQCHGRCSGYGDAPGLRCDCTLAMHLASMAIRMLRMFPTAWHACMQAGLLPIGACCSQRKSYCEFFW